MARPFATVDDLAARWGGYEAALADRAGALLADASARLSALLAASGVGVDESDELQAANLRSACCSAVARCLASSAVADGMPVSQWTETATPYSTSYIFSNPNGDMYFTKAELRSVGLSGGRAGCAPPVRAGA